MMNAFRRQTMTDNARAVPKLGIGLAYQAPLREFISTAGETFNFLEIVPDIFWTDRTRKQRPRYIDDDEGINFLREISAEKFIIPHSIGLSIGSAHRFNHDHVNQVARWHDWFAFPWHSDHLSYCLTAIRLLELMYGPAESDSELNVGMTLPLSRDWETLELVAPRIAEVQARVPARFLLENSVEFIDLPHAEFSEATFLNTLCDLTGCGLLLDLHNLYVNSRNLDRDAHAFLGELNLEHVIELHVAGGMNYQGFYLDAHSGPIPEPVWELLDRVLPNCPNLGGVVFELFGSWFPPMGETRLRAELSRMTEYWMKYQPAPVGIAA